MRGQLMTLFVRDRGCDEDTAKRIGISVPRRIKGSVQRNRLRRLIREAFRLNQGAVPRGCDVVAVPKTDFGEMKLRPVEQEFTDLLLQAVDRIVERKNQQSQ